MSSKIASTPSPQTTPAAAARKPHSGASLNLSPASSLPSSASPPTKSGSSFLTSKAAKPAFISPSSPTSPTSSPVTSSTSKKTGTNSSPSATKSSRFSKRPAPRRPSATNPLRLRSFSAGSTPSPSGRSPYLRNTKTSSPNSS